MAYYTLHAYDADVWIPSFSGLRQSDDIASDLRYAIEAENVETPRGVLQPMAAPEVLTFEGDSYYPFADKIETLARFHRRWYTGTGSKDWMVVASGGKLYFKQENATTWTKLDPPCDIEMTVDGADITATIDKYAYEQAVSHVSGTTVFTYTTEWDTNPETYGITVEGTPTDGDKITVVYVPGSAITFQCNVWSWVTYEINPEGSEAPVDVMLMSNAEDGLIMITPPYEETGEHSVWVVKVIDTRADPLDENEVPKKFGVIERYAERIWGGAIPEDPDMLVYSRPYDPTDWTPAGIEEEPEDGAGSIQQPSWDGDSFTALRSFGNQLIAFKKTRVWRILGTDPGEYTFKEQYGGGTPFPYTIATDVERILMVEKDGMSVYDGLAVNAFNRPYIEEFWKTVNRQAMDQMVGCLFKNRYYLAVPTNGSTKNNAMIIYNVEEGTFLLYTDIYIESLMVTEDKLYATSSTIPGKIMLINYDSWETGVASGKLTKWKTPWMDFNRKSIAKGGYEIYFSPEVKGAPVTFRFSIETEKKIKSKTVTVQTTTFKAKQKRVRFGGTSRRFRLIIETISAPTGATWRFLGGIQMIVETDPD